MPAAACLRPLAVVAGTSLPFLPHFIFGTLPFEDDLLNYFWPVMHRVAAELAAGSLPLWTSDLYTGFPLFADPEAGTLFPLNWILIAFNDPRGLLLILCASLCLSALGMYAFTRHLGVSPSAAMLSAWCWSLGGFATGHLIHVSILNSAAPLPWLMLALDRVLTTHGLERRRWLIVAAALHALQWLGGHAQPALITWSLAGAYLIFRLCLAPHPSAPLRTRAQQLGLLLAVPAVIGAAAFAFAAAQLLPTLELVSASARGVSASYVYGASYSLTPFDLATLLAPFFFLDASGERWSLWAAWETSAYVGILPLLLAALAVLPGPRRGAASVVNLASRSRLFFAAVAIAALWLALGDSAPLAPYRWVQALPLINLLRAPARFLLPFDFALAVLAAIGAERLFSAAQTFDPKPARNLALALATGTLAILCLIFGMAGWIGANRDATLQWFASVYSAFPNGGLPYPPERLFDFLQWSVWLGNPSLAFALLVLLASVLWLVSALRGTLSPRSLRLSALVLVLADLSCFAFGFWRPVGVQSLAQPGPLVASLAARADGTRIFSWPQSATQPDRLLRWGVSEASGYSSLELRSHSLLTAVAVAYDNRLFDMLNVGLLVLPPRPTPVPAGTSPSPPPLDPSSPLLYLADTSPAPQRTFTFSPTLPVGRIRIVSALEHAPQVVQAQQVAHLTLADAAHHRVDLAVRAGVETAEWALDRPDVRPLARHLPAPIALTFEAHDDFSPSYPRHLYAAEFSLAADASGSMALSSLQFGVDLPGVNWLIDRIELLSPAGVALPLLDRFDVAAYEPIVDSPVARVYRNHSALPRAHLVASALLEPDPGRLFDRLVAPTFDPAQLVLLNSGPRGMPSGVVVTAASGPLSATVALHQVAENELEVRVASDRDAWLVLADTWYAGWSADDNGQSLALYPANGTQRAVRVTAGNHLIRFLYAPGSLLAGLIISVLSMAAAALVWQVRRGAPAASTASGRCA